MFALRAASRHIAPSLWTANAVRTNTTIAETVYYMCNYHDKTAIALVCPQAKVQWTYEELWNNIAGLAGGLKSLGYGQGDVVATDASSIGSILLQLAAAHNGMVVATAKDASQLEELNQKVCLRGAVMANSSSFLNNASLPMKHAITDIKGKATEGITDRGLPLAYYTPNHATPNREVYLAGVGTAGLLEISPKDTVCIATNTNTLIGMGSVISAFVRNATVLLPDMAKIDLADSTLVVADESSVDTVRKAQKGVKLRGGMVQVNDGEDVLHKTEDVHGVKLRILSNGSKAEVMRPLFDACKDTYYSFK